MSSSLPALSNHWVPLLLTLLISTASAVAQCAPQWAPGDGVPGANNSVRALHSWDADGPGGAPAVLVAGGTFTIVGSTLASRVAVQATATGAWSPLGSGMSGSGFVSVAAMATLPNGDLIAGGNFGSAGGVAANNIARWNGSVWSPLGGGVLGGAGGDVRALAVLPNGDLVAGGNFQFAGGVSASGIARWDGSTWSPLGTGLAGFSFPWVSSLAVLPNGDLIVGGAFTSVGGVSASSVARWDGSTWSPLGAGVNGTPSSIITLPNNDLIVAGNFSMAGGAPALNIARWNGNAWSAIGTGAVSGSIRSLAATPNGDFIVGGELATAGGISANNIVRWNGSAWTSLGAGVNGVSTSTGVFALSIMPNGDLITGGFFTSAGSVAASSIARWDGNAWSALATGMDDEVRALTTLANGDLLVGGAFTMAGGVPANHVARWNGSTWSPLGTGVNGNVYCFAIMPNGDILAGGSFTEAGGIPANRVARWNGNTWTPLGAGITGIAIGAVYALAVLPNGDLIAAGLFAAAGGTAASNIARWNGSTWTPLGTGLNSTAAVLAVLPNGDLIAGGAFLASGTGNANGIARWDGSSWSPIGGGVSGSTWVSALAVQPNGDLIAGGAFTIAGGVFASKIARWNGGSWSPLGTGLNGTVMSISSLPNGDLLVGGNFSTAGGGSANRIARWNSNTWTPLGTGVDGTLAAVAALAALPSGDVAVGGNFTTANGSVSAYIARYISTCAATVTVNAAGCPSSGGANSLTATSLPWTGATFRAEGSGLPAFAIVGVVNGLNTITTPLPSLLAQGQPGCDLNVSADFVQFVLTTTGTATSSLTLPNTPTLAGTVFHQQMIPFELDAALNFTAITATNSLSMTIGSF